MGAVQRHDGGAVAGFELHAGMASVVEQGDLGWQVHGLNYGATPICCTYGSLHVSLLLRRYQHACEPCWTCLDQGLHNSWMQFRYNTHKWVP